MAQTTSPKPSRMRPWLRVLLFASLALNLAVAGMAAGVFLRGGPLRDHHGDRDFVTPYTRAFDEDQRRDLRRALRDGFVAQRGKDGARPDLIQDYRDALTVLRADPFDPSAMARVLDRQSARAAERQSMGQEVLGTYLAALTPEARAAYAQRLEDEINHLANRRERWQRSNPR